MKLLVLGLLLFSGISFLEGKDKPVRVSLDAKWNSSPILLEASEFMADEGLFIEFVEKLKNQGDLAGLDNAESWYYHTMKLAEQLGSSSRAKLLRFALSMRLYSPKVHLHQQAASEKSQTAGCSAWALVSDQMICEPQAVNQAFRSLYEGAQFEVLYDDDHRRCMQHCDMDRSRPIILYGELGSSQLNNFLRLNTGAYTVLRHFVKEEGDRKLRLSGYGVELAIKSTEYKAQDDSKQGDGDDQEPLEGEISGFNFTKLSQRFPELKKELKNYKNLLSESSNELKPLKVWQMQDLSFQSAQKAISSDESPVAQLEVLKDISQNFPSLASTLAKVSVKSDLRSSIRSTQSALEQYGITSGDSALLVNGITMDVDTVDMFSLYDTIKNDLKIMDELSQHGLANEDIGSLLRQLSNTKDQQFALDIRDSAITYINDLENDEMYRRWPKSLQALLQPTFPGMMRHLSRNLFNLILIFDVNDLSIGNPLSFMATLYMHNAPLRVGLVPVADADDEAGSLLAQIFYKLVEEKDGAEAIHMLSGFYQMLSSMDKKMTIDEIRQHFSKTIGDVTEVDEDEEYIQSREKAYQFFKRSGLTSTPTFLLNGVILKDITYNTMEEVIVQEVLQATPTFQRAVYHGKLKDDMDPLEWLMMQDHVMPRLNPRVLNPNNKCVPINKPAGLTLDSLKYLYKGDDIVRDTTMLVVTDLNTVQGRQILAEAISHMKTTKKVRVGVLHNHDSQGDLSYAKAVQLALDTLDSDVSRGFITKILKETKDKLDNSDLERLATPGLDVKAFIAKLDTHTYNFDTTRAYAAAKLGLRPSELAVVSNNKLIGPLDKGEDFSSDDFSLVEKYGTSGDVVVKITRIIKKMNLPHSKASDILSLVLGTLSCATSDSSRKDIVLEDGGLSMISLPPQSDSEPAFDITAIIEPLSRGAQKILPILLTLQKVLNCQIKVYLNCKDKLSEMPLKSFYRYVLEPDVKFNVVGDLTSGPEALFDNLPHKSILTLNMLPPEGWLVESIRAEYDLDNIKLEQVKHEVEADYELEYLLLEGHCYDAESGQPPRGLQLLLGTENNHKSAEADTLVMANLGYFQLKAKPGAWHLMIRKGRSDDLYSISSHEQTDSSSNDDVVVLMDSFKSKIVSMKVRKRPGMEDMDILSDGKEEEEQGLWSSLSSSFGGGGGGAGEDGEKDEYLNIFSLASGHLYERLMRIMILSIVKQTKSPVKFWLLKNYLSPEFKDFIPVMAEKYGFKFELIQYKWPRWLNSQTEKQRIMWGYKILFLDVLFPLGIKKVAFIDADQIVRTDIQELFDLDLEGAPYGYTPFCSDRTEMDGFRFWKSGYWAGHLGRRPYHISALYVIDLKKFRKIAAGDRLRGQYQSLSQDPNSLSNLDQDLPNNMIHQVKIKSLPQEWLWCETWCSDESKKKAKTIDLCNNPLTKEPKLDAARRIVPEWVGYDTEIKTIWDNWQSNKSTPSESNSNDATSSDKHPEHIEL